MDQGQAVVDHKADLIAALRGAGLVGPGLVVFQPLAGGVSCDVWKVDGPQGPLVVKRPLEKLRVAADWHAPVERSASEVRWLQLARDVEPGMVPEVLADFPALNTFVLRFLPGCPVWKDELSAGHVDPAFAAEVGRRIARVHARTAGSAAVQAMFPDPAMFRALRVDPFLRHVAEHNAEVAAPLRALADRLDAARIALVHGDVSPKNILIGGQDPVFLDAECAVYGDPAFDLAFCTTHLLLKAVWLDRADLQAAAAAMVAAYAAEINWEPPQALLARAGELTAALLLARIEGKSPAPYLTDPLHRQAVRRQAMALLLAPRAIDDLVAHWERTPE